jgi:hypothetical protein
MYHAREQPAGQARLLCEGCGQVIGVYEPLVHVVGGIAHKTSRAADPYLTQSQADAYFHLACMDLGGTDLAIGQ